MFELNRLKTVGSTLLVAIVVSGAGWNSALAQGRGAVELPPARPKVDQLGTMEGLGDPDRTGLVIMLFLQVITCVAVAIALTGHLAMPAKKKPPKA